MIGKEDVVATEYRPRYRWDSDKAAIKLNLGAGEKHIRGFFNVDIDPETSPDCTGDASNIDWLVADNSVDVIVAYDVIEHLDRTKASEALKNWRSKLTSEGLLIIRTPDIDRLVRMYASNAFLRIATPITFDLFIWHLMSEHEKPGMGHKWGYCRGSLEAALNEAGFSHVEFYSEEQLLAGDYPYADQPDFTNMVARAYREE